MQFTKPPHLSLCMAANSTDRRTSSVLTRQPPGIPAGGQFAASSREVSNLDELDMAQDVLTDEPGLSDAELLRVAQEASRAHVRRFGGSVDDVTQEVMVNYLTARRRALANGGVTPGAQSGGRPFPTEAGGQRNYLWTVSRFASTAHMFQHPLHSSTRSAMAKLVPAVSKREQELSRHLTMSEIDALADQIRASTPESSRPAKDFHRYTKMGNFVGARLGDLGKVAFEGDAYAIGQPVDAEPLDDDFAPGSLADRVEAMATMKGRSMDAGRAAQRDARRRVWDAIADIHGAPAAKPEHLAPARSTKLRSQAADMGGASRLVTQWESGKETTESDAVLFAPFGGSDNLSADQKQLVVDVLARHPAHADRLWDAALSAATRTRTQAR